MVATVLMVSAVLVASTVTGDKPQQTNVSSGPFSTIKFPKLIEL